MTLPYKMQDLKPLREKSDQEYTPDQQCTEIQEYAKYIGINLPQQKYLIEVAIEGVMAPLPSTWQACLAPDGELVYRNLSTSVIQSQHPLDEVYKQKVIEVREAYENYEAGQQQLNTIPEQKSEQRSLVDQPQFEQDSVPSKEIFEPTKTLKFDESDSLLNRGMYQTNGKSKQIPSQTVSENSKILANVSSLQQTNKLSIFQVSKQLTHVKNQNNLSKLKPQSDNKIKVTNEEQSEQNNRKQLQKLKMELDRLTQQQKRAQEYLLQLQKDNERRTIALKHKLKLKSKQTKTKKATSKTRTHKNNIVQVQTQSQNSL